MSKLGVAIKRDSLWTPVAKLLRPRAPQLRAYPELTLNPEAVKEMVGGKRGGLVFDPLVLGYDLKQYQTVAEIRQPVEVLDYATAGQDSISLPTDLLITAIMLIADPYRHDVTTAAITAVEDAADKVISALDITGGNTFFNLSSTLLFLKALGAQNKQVHAGGPAHEDLATAVAADNDSRQEWLLNFGAFNDHDLFDVSAGIPAEDITSLLLQATFGANNVIAATAANGTVDTATDIYALVFGVSGLDRDYRDRMPVPEFQHSHVTAPGSTVEHDLLTKRWLKRTTLVNLAVAASNNEPRNDSNITNITFRIAAPGGGTSMPWSRVRWQLFKSAVGLLSGARGPEVERDGSAAILTTRPIGVAVIDWRRLTKNPYGLDLTNVSKGQMQLVLEMGTTTGSIHFFHEYYAMPDPSVPTRWPSWRPS